MNYPNQLKVASNLEVTNIAYYQESGRAGRDQRTARCILFYSREDAERTKYLITQAEARRDAEGLTASQRPAGMSNFEAVCKTLISLTIDCQLLREHDDV